MRTTHIYAASKHTHTLCTLICARHPCATAADVSVLSARDSPKVMTTVQRAAHNICIPPHVSPMCVTCMSARRAREATQVSRTD